MRLPSVPKLKRTLYEWSSLSFALLAFACLTCWVSSFFTKAGTFTLILPSNTVIRSEGGNVAVGDRSFDPFELHTLANDPTLDPVPQSVRSVGTAFVGFTQIRYADSSPWALTISWLILVFVFAFLSFICFVRYRDAHRSANKLLSQTAQGGAR